MLPTNTIDLHDHHLDPGMGRSPEVDDQLKQSQLPIMHECGKKIAHLLGVVHLELVVGGFAALRWYSESLRFGKCSSNHPPGKQVL